MKPDVKFVKLTAWINCSVPAGLLVFDAVRGSLGANPINFAIRTTGVLALIYLTLSLTVTPIARVIGWNWLLPARKVLGLSAFFHAASHLALFFFFDRAASLSSTFSEMILRPYLTVGAASLLLMTPLAITSTNGMVRLLGAARWKLLHRLAYPAAMLGVAHYYMLVKSDTRDPIAFGIVVAALLGYRAWHALFSGRKSRTVVTAATAETAVPAARTSATVYSPESLNLGTLSPAMPAIAIASASGGSRRLWTGELLVSRIMNETPDIRTFRLVSPAGGVIPFVFLPGQYLNISLPIDGQQVKRSYTIASSPSRTAYCEITVKREPRGLASAYLHAHLKEGDRVQISAPAGKFTFTGEGAAGIVLLAGGVGITPLMSKLRYLTDTGWSGEIDLLYCVKTPADIAFQAELEFLQGQNRNLRVHVTVSRDAGQDWPGERGRITPQMIQRLVPGFASRPIHLCGPEEMNRQLTLSLIEFGIPAEQIQTESFHRSSLQPELSQEDTGDFVPEAPQNGDVVAGPASVGENTAAVAGSSAARITFRRSGKSFDIGRDQSILEAAEAGGVPLDSDCRAGICGTCKTRRLSGKVRLEADDALSSSEKRSGIILACQAYCEDHVVVEA